MLFYDLTFSMLLVLIRLADGLHHAIYIQMFFSFTKVPGVHCLFSLFAWIGHLLCLLFISIESIFKQSTVIMDKSPMTLRRSSRCSNDVRLCQDSKHRARPVQACVDQDDCYCVDVVSENIAVDSIEQLAANEPDSDGQKKLVRYRCSRWQFSALFNTMYCSLTFKCWGYFYLSFNGLYVFLKVVVHVIFV